ncbi:Steroid delta5-4-isomerase [Penicillium camemberti]|uniref:Steroid delta5-4-isomerase n=1 Tax=Penicillium camemberti (strain FM 013) TaxID=1429867 RepID=A0A0G4PVY7_PENC3|nr:Steroid delta5-4-isomerase [Penicillium camemberti]
MTNECGSVNELATNGGVRGKSSLLCIQQWGVAAVIETALQLSSPDTEAISTVLHAYGAALKARNVEEVLALYTTDGVIMPPHFPASAGLNSLRASYTRIFSTIELVITFQIEEIVMMSPEWGFARTTAEGTKTILALNESEPHANQELFIMKKENGKWLIARYAFSTMKPLVQNGIQRS